MQRREGGGKAMMRGEEGGDGGWKDGRGGGRTRTNTDDTKKRQRREGTPLDNGPNQLMRWSGIGASGVIGDQRWIQLATRQLTASDKWRRDGREYRFVTRDVKARGMQGRKRRKEGMTREGGDRRCMLHPRSSSTTRVHKY